MRRDRDAVSPVVAVMLLLMITVVLAATVYLVASSLVQDIGARPFVGLSVLSQNNTRAQIVVAEVSQSNIDLYNFKSVLVVDGTPDRSSDLSPIHPGTAGNATFTSADNVLNSGDAFVIAISANHAYSLRILWSNGGDQVGLIEWHT